jgi:hypothetical protein
MKRRCVGGEVYGRLEIWQVHRSGSKIAGNLWANSQEKCRPGDATPVSVRVFAHSRLTRAVLLGCMAHVHSKRPPARENLGGSHTSAREPL